MSVVDVDVKYPQLKASDAAKLLSWAFERGRPVLLIGRPGVGKTSIVRQTAEALGMDLIVSHPVVDDPTDYKGMPFSYRDIVDGVERQRASFLPFGDLERLIEAEVPTVHFADDLGHAPRAVQAAYMQLLLNRSVNSHRISDRVSFVAASNRVEDRAGVTALLEPLKDRFSCIVEVVPDLYDWVAWAIRNDMPHELISYVRYCPKVLEAWRPTPDLTRLPTCRGLAEVGAMIRDGIPQEVLPKAVVGAIGKEYGMEFMSFMDVYRDLPDPDFVLMAPAEAAVPEGAAALYALCGALAARVSETTISSLFVYASRVPDEYSVMMVKDMIVRFERAEAGGGAKAKLYNNKHFVQWVSAHKDVLI